MTQYQIDADMLGETYCGTNSELHNFIPHLCKATGRPSTDFVVRQHIGQWIGTEEPTEQEWNTALETFYAEFPELFED